MTDWWANDPIANKPAAPPPAPKPAGGGDNWWANDPVAQKPAASAAPKPVGQQDMSWGDVGLQALENTPGSALQFAEDTGHAIMHPIDTVESLGKVAHGAAQDIGVAGGTGDEKYANAVGNFFMKRYGNMENIKHTLATDPVGVAADLSTFLTGGEGALARAPGIAGRVGEIAGDVGRIVDPVNAAAKVAGKVGSGAAEIIGNLGTHTGGEAIREAARAGYEGGQKGRDFQENLRGKASMTDAVDDARSALNKIRMRRGQTYRANMAQHVATDPTVLDFKHIDKAVQDAGAVKTYKGQSLSPSTQQVNDKMQEAVNDWRALDPAQFHTVEGLDALKQKIGDIRDSTQYGTPERVAADNVYRAIRKTIIAQAPEYGKIMKGYEEATDQIKEIERSLSLNKNASVDTALRKLQSILRDNVNSNYGQRKALADYIIHSGAPNLMAKLAGQALHPWTARGLGKLGMQVAAELGLAGVAPHAAGAMIASAPFMSPRLVGEGAYYTGKGAKAAGKVPAGAYRGAFQAGRAADQADEVDIRPMTPEEQAQYGVK